jgi:RNA polymerase sigma-70 factor (ECF subfamily)
VRHTYVDDSRSEAQVAAARTGDQDAFERLAEPYRRELQLHCYRMLGSIEDAEDAVQDTYLRAWKRLESYAGTAPFRAWLYGIATHASLDALRRRKARVWPTDVAEPSDPRRGPAPPAELPWLQPYPDRLLEAAAPADSEPEALVTAKETVELAFLASIQRLPPRQRAVLILRDVLDWSAKETAAALGATQASVNSALQRARATLADHLPASRAEWTLQSTATEKAMLQRLIAAWEKADTAALVALLRADARLVMPPRPSWFAGRDDIEFFFREHVFGTMGGGWKIGPTMANRQPAFTLHWRAPDFPDAPHHPFGIGVVTTDGGAITELAMFIQPELLRHFAAPARP